MLGRHVYVGYNVSVWLTIGHEIKIFHEAEMTDQINAKTFV